MNRNQSQLVTSLRYQPRRLIDENDQTKHVSWIESTRTRHNTRPRHIELNQLSVNFVGEGGANVFRDFFAASTAADVPIRAYRPRERCLQLQTATNRADLHYFINLCPFVR